VRQFVFHTEIIRNIFLLNNMNVRKGQRNIFQDDENFGVKKLPLS